MLMSAINCSQIDEIIEEFNEDEAVDESNAGDYDGGGSESLAPVAPPSAYRKQAREAIDYI